MNFDALARTEQEKVKEDSLIVAEKGAGQISKSKNDRISITQRLMEKRWFVDAYLAPMIKHIIFKN